MIKDLFTGKLKRLLFVLLLGLAFGQVAFAQTTSTPNDCRYEYNKPIYWKFIYDASGDKIDSQPIGNPNDHDDITYVIDIKGFKVTFSIGSYYDALDYAAIKAKIDAVAQASSDIQAGFDEALAALADANGVIDQSKTDQLNRILNDTVNKSNGYVGGDPVRFTTGEYVNNDSDAAFADILVNRLYNSGAGADRSFGKKWGFNYDSRVIMGVRPHAEANALYSEDIYNQSSVAFDRFYNGTAPAMSSRSYLPNLPMPFNAPVFPGFSETIFVTGYDEAISLIDRTLPDLNNDIEQLKVDVAKVRSELESVDVLKPVVEKTMVAAEATSPTDPNVPAPTVSIIPDSNASSSGPILGSEAEAKKYLYQWVHNTFYVEMTTKLDALEKLKTKLEQTRAKLIADKAAVEQKLATLDVVNKGNHDEANLAGAIESKNVHVVGPNDPSHLLYSGRNTITWVDERAVPHTYYIDSEPLFISTVTYPDGTLNYFPQGSTTTAANPEDSTLELMDDGSYVVSHKDGSKSYYTYYGLLEKKVDRNGNETAFIYDVNYRLQEVVDSYGRKLVLTRDAEGRIVQTLDPAGRQYSYAYAGGMLSSVTDPVGDTIGYEYDLEGNITAIVKPDGSKRRYYYENVGGTMRVKRTADEEWGQEYFDYNLTEKYTDYTNQTYNWSRHYYNDRALTYKIKQADNTLIHMDYDANDNMISRTDENGLVTYYEYDGARNVTKVTKPDGAVTSMTYNSFNRPLTITDPLGNVTTMSYDLKGNLTGTTYPDGTTESTEYDTRGRVSARVDRRGSRTTFAYDQWGNLQQVTDAEGNVHLMSSDVVGQLVSTTDPAGSVTSYQYRGDGKVTTVTDAAGGVKTFAYNNRKDLVQVTDGNNNVTLMEYDRRHNPVRITKANGDVITAEYRMDGKVTKRTVTGAANSGAATTTFAYNLRAMLTEETQVETGITVKYEYCPTGQLDAVINGELGVTDYIYDAFGRLSQVVDPAGSATTYEYNLRGETAAVTDPLGNRTAFTYDTMGRVVEKLNPDLGAVKYAYDGAGNRVKVTDPLNRETLYSYDRLHRLTGTTNGAGHSRAFTYGLNGKVATASDERGSVTGYSYDSLGRLTAKTAADGGVTAYSYDANGNLLSETDPRMNVTGYTYDSLNRVTTATNAAGGVTTYGYNYQGQVIEQKDALNNITGYQYDTAGRMTSTTNPLGAVTHYTYDKNHRLLTTKDGLNRTTAYTYNAVGNLLSETDPSSIVNSYEYDANGNRTKFTDGNLNVYSYSYDVMNRLTVETNPALVSQSYSYDLAGQLTGKTDYSGKSTTYSYDNRGLLTTTTFADMTTKSMSYDPAGNMLTAVNENSTLTYSYDNMNRVATYSDSHIGENVSYTYDLAGNRTALKWLNSQRVTNYSYNNLNLLEKITDPDNKVVNYNYDVLGRETEKVSGTADRTLTGYDAAGQITTIKSNGQSQAYLYNAAGERTHTVNDNGHVQIYRYDDSGRLSTVYYPFFKKFDSDHRELENYGVTSGAANTASLDRVTTTAEKAQINSVYSQVKGIGGPAVLSDFLWEESFSYDNAGNRLTKSNGYGTINYSYNNLNQLTNAGTRTLEYDANGNLTKEVFGTMSAAYKYNAENRLVDIYSTIPGLEGQGQYDDHKGTVYKYDALGRRVERDDYRIDVNNGATVWASDKNRHFLYDGGSFNILAEYTKGVNAASISPVAENVRDRRGRVAIRKEMSGLSTNGTQYHTQDLLGSTMAVTGSNATRYSYDAFGRAFEGQLSDVQNVGFNGKNYDNKTALYDYGFRHYSALVGRWNRLDPIKDGYNWYVYCGNDPVNYVDWLGLETKIFIKREDVTIFGVTINIGGHAAVLVTDPAPVGITDFGNFVGDEPLVVSGAHLYDPSGGYHADTRGYDGFLTGELADADRYIRWQESNENVKINVYTFDTTPEEEAEIVKRIYQLKDPRGLNCSKYVSKAIKNIGPFDMWFEKTFPGNLESYLINLKKKDKNK